MLKSARQPTSFINCKCQTPARRTMLTRQAARDWSIPANASPCFTARSIILIFIPTATAKPLRVFLSRENRLTDAKRILLVDDEALARQRLRRYLAQTEYRFVLEEAQSGLEAVEKIHTFQPDIIFLDIEMPGLNGFEVLQQVNERPFQVVFQTAFDEFAVRAFEALASDYLLKPFTSANRKFIEGGL